MSDDHIVKEIHSSQIKDINPKDILYLAMKDGSLILINDDWNLEGKKYMENKNKNYTKYKNIERGKNIHGYEKSKNIPYNKNLKTELNIKDNKTQNFPVNKYSNNIRTEKDYSHSYNNYNKNFTFKGTFGQTGQKPQPHSVDYSNKFSSTFSQGNKNLKKNNHYKYDELPLKREIQQSPCNLKSYGSLSTDKRKEETSPKCICWKYQMSGRNSSKYSLGNDKVNRNKLEYSFKKSDGSNENTLASESHKSKYNQYDLNNNYYNTYSNNFNSKNHHKVIKKVSYIPLKKLNPETCNKCGKIKRPKLENFSHCQKIRSYSYNGQNQYSQKSNKNTINSCYDFDDEIDCPLCNLKNNSIYSETLSVVKEDIFNNHSYYESIGVHSPRTTVHSHYRVLKT